MRMNDIITVITSVKLILAGWFEIQLLVELELRMFWRNESIPINENKLQIELFRLSFSYFLKLLNNFHQNLF